MKFMWTQIGAQLADDFNLDAYLEEFDGKLPQFRISVDPFPGL